MGKLQAKREAFLMKSLLATGRISTQEATRSLNVSEATVRRLFTSMEKGGKVVRDYGGIVLLHQNYEYDFEKREQQFAREKQLIGMRAASLISDGDTVYLDCGTTTFHLALSLLKRFEENSLKSVQIITNSIVNLQTLAPRCRVILLGGEYDERRRDITGPISARFLEYFHFSKSFLGAEGIAADEGFMSDEPNTACLNEAVIRHSDAVYVLADASKLGKRFFLSYGKLDQVDGIITAGRMEKNEVKALKTAGAPLIDAGIAQ